MFARPPALHRMDQRRWCSSSMRTSTTRQKTFSAGLTLNGADILTRSRSGHRRVRRRKSYRFFVREEVAGSTVELGRVSGQHIE